ncbi:MAG: SymE family type I addiction module toxin [Oribacterium sp.]
MVRARKEYRELMVSEATNYGMKRAPMLRIQGLWFQELGFNVGDPVLVKYEEGKLIIMADTAMAELKKAEKAFMEGNFSRSSRRKRRNSGQGSWQSVRRITAW